MQYIALIYDEEREINLNDPDTQALYEAYGAFTQKIIAAGQFKAGDELQPSSTATCVKRRDGKVVTTDGPFAETKEQLGGYYLLECADLDEAIAVASEIPSAAFGAIEVRPVVIREG